MSYSDDVRNYCVDNYIAVARNSGTQTVLIRVGDVHKAMSYKDRIPLVCSSLGAKKFEEFANVERISIEGPTNGANTIYTFKVL